MWMSQATVIIFCEFQKPEWGKCQRFNCVYYVSVRGHSDGIIWVSEPNEDIMWVANVPKGYCMTVRGYSWDILSITVTTLWKLCGFQWPQWEYFVTLGASLRILWVSQVTVTVLDHSECIIWVSEVTIILCECIRPHQRYLVSIRGHI